MGRQDTVASSGHEPPQSHRPPVPSHNSAVGQGSGTIGLQHLGTRTRCDGQSINGDIAVRRGEPVGVLLDAFHVVDPYGQGAGGTRTAEIVMATVLDDQPDVVLSGYTYQLRP